MQAAAEHAGTSVASMLALQCASAAAGSMASIPSMAVARSALAAAGFADVAEGVILRRCLPALAVSLVVAAAAALPLIL